MSGEGNIPLYLGLGHGRARLQAADVRFAPSDERKERAVARPKTAYTGDERREEHGIGAAPVLSHYASVGKGHHLTEARRKHHMPPCGGRRQISHCKGGARRRRAAQRPRVLRASPNEAAKGQL